ncbi:MAG: NTP/NDP exchange transporter [Rickettsiales bacterium]|nr:MAG: NTP/NDP exchange transporter [Rickettsiales bacterium]
MPTISDNNSISSENSSLKNSKYKQFFDYIWPIHQFELPKFLFITLLMFCILGIQNLIRAMKDSVINTMIGPETISFLKFWGVLPAAFLVTIIYVKLVNVMKGENIFYLIMSIFLGFFILFAFYLYPNYETFHLSTDTANGLITRFPNFKWFILLLSNWSFSLFYIIAELWPNAIFALLFWQFVNKVTTVDESKRFYPLFSLLGQTGLYLSGTFLINLPFISDYFANLYSITDDINVISIKVVISVVLCLGVIALGSFWLLNHKILDLAATENLQFKVKKNQMNLKESIKMICSSRYIRLITILLFCYGLAINLVEGPWKAEATKIYKTPIEFAAFVGNYLSYTGILTILFVLLGSNIVRKLGWLSAAVITPFMVLISGLGFFIVANFDYVATFMMLYFSFTDPIMFALVMGAIQNILSKSSKYTLFDSTKEMSYVPLDEQIKTKGKAAADMIGTKLGKSTSALLQSMIFIIIPSATFSSISIYLMIAFVIICFVWLWTVFELNKEYIAACNKQ